MSDTETLDLASETQRLRERVAELEAEVPYVTDLRAANGQLDMTIQGAKSTLSAMATALAKNFEADGGINYVQYEVRSGDKDFVLTLQRAAGKTPHQLRQEAESRALKAEAERDAALAQLATEREAHARTVAALEECLDALDFDNGERPEHACQARGRAAIAAALPSTPAPTHDYSGLCAAPSCEGHCGYVHARGCEAVREYLADHGGKPYRAPSKAATRG